MAKKVRKEKAPLMIEWQRLVDSGETCPRCGSTEKELEKAVKLLKGRGIKATLVKKELSLKEFRGAPLESNRILINDRPLESWLGAKTGKSRCCEACGDAKCRTVSIGKQTYETILAKLIVKAGIAASKELTAGQTSL